MKQIVNLVWADKLRSLLLKRFPAMTEEQLQEARGYAYGAVIQDLGYYAVWQRGVQRLSALRSKR